MNTIRIDSGLPCCQNREADQTKISICLRTAMVVIGTLTALSGILIAFNILGIGTTPIGWSMASLGTLLTLTGFAVRLVKHVSTSPLPNARQADPLNIPSEPFPFSLLPENMQFEILKSADTKTIGRVARISKQYKQFIEKEFKREIKIEKLRFEALQTFTSHFQANHYRNLSKFDEAGTELVTHFPEIILDECRRALQSSKQHSKSNINTFLANLMVISRVLYDLCWVRNWFDKPEWINTASCISKTLTEIKNLYASIEIETIEVGETKFELACYTISGYIGRSSGIPEHLEVMLREISTSLNNRLRKVRALFTFYSSLLLKKSPHHANAMLNEIFPLLITIDDAQFKRKVIFDIIEMTSKKNEEQILWLYGKVNEVADGLEARKDDVLCQMAIACIHQGHIEQAMTTLSRLNSPATQERLIRALVSHPQAVIDHFDQLSQSVNSLEEDRKFELAAILATTLWAKNPKKATELIQSVESYLSTNHSDIILLKVFNYYLLVDTNHAEALIKNFADSQLAVSTYITLGLALKKSDKERSPPLFEKAVGIVMSKVNLELHESQMISPYLKALLQLPKEEYRFLSPDTKATLTTLAAKAAQKYETDESFSLLAIHDVDQAHALARPIKDFQRKIHILLLLAQKI